MIEVVLKPCPWCDKTPELDLPYNCDTWLWKINCSNKECRIKPNSPYTPVRKTTKRNPEKMFQKLRWICTAWNKNNPRIAKEKKIVDLSKIGIKLNFTFRIDDHAYDRS